MKHHMTYLYTLGVSEEKALSDLHEAAVNIKAWIEHVVDRNKYLYFNLCSFQQ
jgi:hypothetical protein